MGNNINEGWYTMKTYWPKEIHRDWWLINAEGKVLGRLATKIALLLMGKRKPDYSPHIDGGDFVVVINADKIVLTGKKWKEKLYYRHSGYPGGLKVMTAGQMKEKHPEEIIRLAVKRMLPKNKLGRRMLKRLKVYAGSSHPHKAQNPQVLNIDEFI